MSLAQNKALAKRAIDAWSSGDAAVADEICVPDYVNHQNHTTIRGTAAWKKLIAEFHRAFPDFKDTIEDQVAEGDRVVTRFTSRGTHKGTILGVAATGRAVSWTGIAIDRIENGRIVESWVSWDELGLLRQLGAS